MSWLDVRSNGQFNRTAYQVLSDGTENRFNFRYAGSRNSAESNAVTGLDMEKKMVTIETPSAIRFNLETKIRIGEDAYYVSDITDLEPTDQNGRWRSSTIRIQRLNIWKKV